MLCTYFSRKKRKAEIVYKRARHRSLCKRLPLNALSNNEGKFYWKIHNNEWCCVAVFNIGDKFINLKHGDISR
jgi:hypothetical protein